ncbi:MAG: 16S rRNA (adenine(1518)-N(6)/adenine(1519)-N(6))-dimethyltransferase RsmA [Prevotellaceae bacterium]|jgi:16S rRNA (adenine1518-N6/adenine1519-N6)-dimethyltransferase|nr:16S rRNA (adenine(1518)-N(6)/adenine(1519)-N(6))-dimethyltransferase RsmA [Prevotellaceae bacterium]
MYVRPKKALGQHFLQDVSVAQRIVDALCSAHIPDGYCFGERFPVLEVGPGRGVLTQFLLGQEKVDLCAVELDREAVDYLLVRYPELNGRLIHGDFLNLDVKRFFSGPFLIIGNFPYNISSQIFFRILDHRDQVPMAVGMVQKEVAERIASPPGNKTYGILSVLLQAWYNIEYLFTVSEGVFVPPPKVKSAVIRISRNDRKKLDCSEILFKQLVKATFNQRRKTIRNSIKSVTGLTPLVDHPILALRPEQLGVEQFIELTNYVEMEVSQESIMSP